MSPDEMNPHELLQQGLEILTFERPQSPGPDFTRSPGPRKTLRVSTRESVEPGGKKINLMEKFLDELEMWNHRVRLVSGDRRDIVIRHLLDSLAVYPMIRDLAKGGTGEEIGAGEEIGTGGKIKTGGTGRDAAKLVEIADIGSGNGFPVIPLALWDESLSFQLVERSGKKAVFLRNVVGVLGLGDRVEVLECDVREVDRQFSLVLSRAFMPMSAAVPLMRATVGKKAVLLFYAGKRATIDEELHKLEEHSGEAVEAKVLPVEVPFLSEERHVCLVYPGRHGQKVTTSRNP